VAWKYKTIIYVRVLAVAKAKIWFLINEDDPVVIVGLKCSVEGNSSPEIIQVRFAARSMVVLSDESVSIELLSPLTYIRTF
jgi:hypothetical protein